MNKVQLWHDMKEYFQNNGVKEYQSEKDVSYEEMYDEQYCNWLSHFYYCTFNKPCDLESEDIDELCEKVWNIQYEIETKLKEEFNKTVGE